MKTLDEINAGFIGAGAMGSVLLKTALGVMAAERIFVTSKTGERSGRLASELGVNKAADNGSLVERCDVVFLAVKPAQFPDLLSEIAPFSAGKILVSVAAGITLASIRGALSSASPAALVRIMPNIAAAVGQGMTVLAIEETPPGPEGASALECAALVSGILAPSGRVERLPEDLMDCVTAISGGGPAYGFIFIEALADAAVILGMPRAAAYTFAAQTLKGAASLVLESGLHPAALKDSVCSPAGTTIEAVCTLERGGFRAAVMDATLRAARKSRALARKISGANRRAPCEK
ncbi:MAG: pyrroline-5-carboxylate reductase [Spirochaetaceae bacterium]|jgi:pyrroline-5-carboxylate reductase|nr:pyrroline-5-carboxylate reductase [Spirochaetaceae bacterium]